MSRPSGYLFENYCQSYAIVYSLMTTETKVSHQKATIIVLMQLLHVRTGHCLTDRSLKWCPKDGRAENVFVLTYSHLIPDCYILHVRYNLWIETEKYYIYIYIHNIFSMIITMYVYCRMSLGVTWCENTKLPLSDIDALLSLYIFCEWALHDLTVK